MCLALKPSCEFDTNVSDTFLMKKYAERLTQLLKETQLANVQLGFYYAMLPLKRVYAKISKVLSLKLELEKERSKILWVLR